MKHLYLLRHGIAVPSGTPGIADEDRPLTTKGERRIREIGQGLRQLNLRIERILTSPLPRALKTAEIVARVLGMETSLEVVDALRADRDAASIRDWLATRHEDDLMLVGHNPSLSDLIGVLLELGGGSLPCELSKGGIAALKSTAGSALRLDWLARPRILRRLGERRRAE